MKFLIDECLHTSLVGVAHAAGHAADHVAHIGLAGWTDQRLIEKVLALDYTFVTNNRLDFLRLFGSVELYAGLVVIVPSVGPKVQALLFEAVLQHIGGRTLVNAVIEVEHRNGRAVCLEYEFPASNQS